MISLSGGLAPLEREVRKRFRSPYGPFGQRPLLLHAGHHRCGTVWFGRVLSAIARDRGFRIQNLPEACDVRPHMDLLVYEQGGRDFDPARLPTDRFLASHLVRDPRDIVVSGYHYHLWTDERWAIEPWDRYDGQSYQDVLRSLPMEEGLAEEIRVSSLLVLPGMVDRKWDRPEVLEVRYEDLVADEDATFARIFRHYGFTDLAVRESVRTARDFTFTKVTGRSIGQTAKGEHLRSGRPGEWREVLTREHLALFDALNPGLVAGLGYDGERAGTRTEIDLGAGTARQVIDLRDDPGSPASTPVPAGRRPGSAG